MGIAIYLLMIGLGWMLGSLTMLTFFWYRIETVRINIESKTLGLREALAKEKAKKAGRLEVVVKHERASGAISSTRTVFFDSVGEGDALEALKRAYHLHRRGESFSTRNLSPVLSRHQFEQFRDELLQREMLAWSGEDKRAGVAWTEPGQALIEAAALRYA